MPLLGTGTAGVLVSVLLMIYKTINGKKCRSRCCNQDLEMGFETGDMTPIETKEFVVLNPSLKPSSLPSVEGQVARNVP